MRLDDCTLGSHDGYIYIITMYQYILLCVRYTSIIHYRTA